VSLDVLLRPEDQGEVEALLGKLTQGILRSWADALGHNPPEFRVRGDRGIPPGTFEVRAGGAVRVAASLDVPLLEWWTAHPVSGCDGRTGMAPGGTVGEWSPARLIARAVEETLWDNPDLFWSDAAAAPLSGESDEGAGAEEPTDQAVLMHSLASRRVPIVDRTKLHQALARLDPDMETPSRAERLACELLPADVVVEAGTKLMEEIPTNRFEELASRVLEHLTYELGITFPGVRQELAPDLPPRGYRIVINRLPRGTAQLPAGHRLVEFPPFEPTRAESVPWINPVTGRFQSWLLEGRLEAPDVARTTETDAAEALGLHLAGCLREASGDFCDLAWAQQTLDRVKEGFPRLVDLARQRHSDERLTAILRGLVSEGISLRPLVPILGRLLEFEHVPPMALVQDEAEMSGGLSWTEDDPASLVAYLRTGLKPYITHQLTSGSGILTAWALSDPAQRAIRELARTGGLDGAAYACPAAANILRQLSRILAAWPGQPPPTILAPIDLRGAVRRLVAAQAPRVPVVARPELMPGTGCMILGQLGE